MPGEERLLKPSEAARAIGVATSTLARWRRDGLIIPAEMTAGGQARYRLSDLRAQIREIYRHQKDDSGDHSASE